MVPEIRTSATFPRRTAAMMPPPTPNRRTSTQAYAASSKVGRIFGRITWETGA